MLDEEKSKKWIHGDGRIYRLSTGLYGYAKKLGKDHNGKRIRKVVTGKSEEEVIKKILIFLENAGYIEKSKPGIRLKDCIKDYFQRYVNDKVKDDTKKDYLRLASYFEIIFGGVFIV